MKLLFVVTCFTFCVQAVYSLSCSCNPSNCVEPTCSGGIVRDICGCCKVCAKLEQEQCGGLFDMYGLCDKNLTCVLPATSGALLTEHKPGKCKPTNQLTPTDRCYEATYYGCNLVDRECECSQQVACSNPFRFQSLETCFNYSRSNGGTRKECINVHCSIPQSRYCPDDSFLIEGYTPPDQCCPIPSRCECRADRCAYNLCPPKTRRVLVKSGSDNPGSCCDEYQCVPQGSEEDCSKVECSISSLSSISCPSDSAAIRIPHSSSACCHGEPICHCDKTLCPSPPPCADGLKLKVAYRGNERPGSCCDEYVCATGRVFVGCLVNNTRYEHGAFYQSKKCQYCECVMGLSRCGPPSCPPLTCSDIIFDDSVDCCPRCLHQDGGSSLDPNPPCKGKDGRTYAFGETWSTDDCTHCTCKGGEPQCKAAFCREPSVTPDTPSCLSLAQCKLKDGDCRYGFDHNDEMCRTCHCRSDILGCQPLTDCLITCPMGHVVDQSGCNTCECRQRKCKELPESCQKQCPYGFKQNKKNCERCKCRNCPSVNLCKKKCSLGLAENKHGCPICKCKVESSDVSSATPVPAHMCTDPVVGSRHDDGETWSGDQCHMCLCRGGVVVCDVIQCPVLSCDKPIMHDGDCCPTCQATDSPAYRMLSCRDPGGDWFVEGEIWEYNQCTTCTCHAGHVMCTSSECPPIPCENPVYDENLCCPKCISEPRNNQGSKSCAENGSVYGNGDEFKIGPCTSCVCRDGAIKCYREHCPAVISCTNPVVKRGQCCARCLGDSPSLRSCATSDGARTHAEEWNKTSSACTTCMCVDGTVKCKQPDCRPIPRGCRRLYRRPGECCQICVLRDNSPKPSVPSYPNSAGSNQTLPIALSISFIFIFLFLVFILALYIFKRWYPEKFHSLRFRQRNRHKTHYTTGTEQNQMTNRSESSERIEVRSGSVGGGSSGTARSDMTNLSSLLDEKITK